MNSSSRPSGTRKLFMRVTGVVGPVSDTTAVRPSGVMLAVIDFSFAGAWSAWSWSDSSLHLCALTARMYNDSTTVVKTDGAGSGGRVAATEEETGRFRQRRRTRAAIVEAAAELLRAGR